MNSKSSRFEDFDSTQNIINSYDITAIEELDPALADGFKVIFDKEFPVELRYILPISSPPKTPRRPKQPQRHPRKRPRSHNDPGISLSDHLNFQGDQSKYSAIKVEFSSENDLFFHYLCM
jgi:hypothetical protein